MHIPHRGKNNQKPKHLSNHVHMKVHRLTSESSVHPFACWAPMHMISHKPTARLQWKRSITNESAHVSILNLIEVSEVNQYLPSTPSWTHLLRIIHAVKYGHLAENHARLHLSSNTKARLLQYVRLFSYLEKLHSMHGVKPYLQSSPSYPPCRAAPKSYTRSDTARVKQTQLHALHSRGIQRQYHSVAKARGQL